MSKEIITRTIEDVRTNNFKFKKKYGQNFLVDNNILNKIIEKAGITSEDLVIEIGPGAGALTERLIHKCKELIVIEIDKELIPILQEKFSDKNNIKIINEDCLNVDFNSFVENYDKKNVKVVANLPYYITTPIIMQLLEKYSDIIDTITVMVQKEVADRFAAKPGTKDYGAITLACNFYTEIEKITDVSPNCFIPRPNVVSTVIKMKMVDNYKDISNSAELFKFIKVAFNQRRKTLINAVNNSGQLNIKRDELENILIELGHNHNIRGEALSLEEFIKIVERII